MLGQLRRVVVQNKGKVAIAVAGILAMGAVTTKALAGLKVSVPVTVNLASGTASGSIGTARNTANAIEWIGCGISYTTGGGPLVTCQATNTTGTSLSCVADTTDAWMLDAVESMPSEAFISFHRNAGGRCDSIEWRNHSYFEPKLP
ncbi:hypothetical protein [Polyangium jinanense]|uniref:Uncharacterized protein n=1 Tax=Polyangium jinanense TaxID=2829994 RepID=A0A9X3XE64_9BACT|nr:hypothetical protein [Polyangium jinanense]MDC3961262.1 hypothetical protein [Polyangium jinanense]MDC3988959.1 hypothetical protein [Polyangium jinanense]